MNLFKPFLACPPDAETAPLAVLRVPTLRSFPRSGIGIDPGGGMSTACRTLLVSAVAISAPACPTNGGHRPGRSREHRDQSGRWCGNCMQDAIGSYGIGFCPGMSDKRGGCTSGSPACICAQVVPAILGWLVAWLAAWLAGILMVRRLARQLLTTKRCLNQIYCLLLDKNGE